MDVALYAGRMKKITCSVMAIEASIVLKKQHFGGMFKPIVLYFCLMSLCSCVK